MNLLKIDSSFCVEQFKSVLGTFHSRERLAIIYKETMDKRSILNFGKKHFQSTNSQIDWVAEKPTKVRTGSWWWVLMNATVQKRDDNYRCELHLQFIIQNEEWRPAMRIPKLCKMKSKISYQ